MNDRHEVSVEDYESFFKRFDNLEFDHDTEQSNDDTSIYYLERIQDDIRQYHRPE